MKAQEMKMFRNEVEYNKAVALLEKLGDREGFEDNAELVKQFELLSKLIEAYENKNAHIDVGNPIEIIKLKMKYMGLKQKDLQPYIGSSGIVSEVLNKKRPTQPAKPSQVKAKVGTSVSNDQLLNEINSLPAHLRREVSDFVAFLKYKRKQKAIV